jgi:hypothetical protein
MTPWSAAGYKWIVSHIFNGSVDHTHALVAHMGGVVACEKFICQLQPQKDKALTWVSHTFFAIMWNALLKHPAQSSRGQDDCRQCSNYSSPVKAIILDILHAEEDSPASPRWLLLQRVKEHTPIRVHYAVFARVICYWLGFKGCGKWVYG